MLVFLKKKFKLTETFDRAVVRYSCYFMWAGEIWKTFRMVNHDDFGPVGYYPLWMGPFHVCSMALYAYLIIGAKHPKKKLVEWVMPFGYATMLLVTCLILTIPASSGILGTPEDWSFCFENQMPYQAWVYHGCLVFVPLYMVLSGLYRPRWSDIYKSFAVLAVCATFAQALNYGFDGSGADFMTLRYGNGNPLAFLLDSAPALYYIVLAVVVIGGVSLILAATIGIQALLRSRAKRTRRSGSSDISL